MPSYEKIDSNDLLKLNLDNEEKVTLLNPRNINQGYLIDSGFVTTNKNMSLVGMFFNIY